MMDNWQEIDSCFFGVPEAVSSRCGGQGVTVFLEWLSLFARRRLDRRRGTEQSTASDGLRAGRLVAHIDWGER